MFRKLLEQLSGRTTAFLASFFVLGHVMHFLHRLDGTYIAYMGALMGFVLGHSVKEDMFPDKAKSTVSETTASGETTTASVERVTEKSST
jgi:hypothetical protein